MEFKNKLNAGNIRKINSIQLMDEFESISDNSIHTYDTLVFGRWKSSV